MGLYQKLTQKVEGWLFKEEIAAAQEQHGGMNADQIRQEREKLEELLEKVKADIEMANEQIAIIDAEDHSVLPEQGDIDRYFQYHTVYCDNIKHATESTGMWVSREVNKMTKEEFVSGAAVGGWKFLRESCGLPQGKLGSAPWKDAGSGWSTES